MIISFPFCIDTAFILIGFVTKIGVPFLITAVKSKEIVNESYVYNRPAPFLVYIYHLLNCLDTTT